MSHRNMLNKEQNFKKSVEFINNLYEDELYKRYSEDREQFCSFSNDNSNKILYLPVFDYKDPAVYNDPDRLIEEWNKSGMLILSNFLSDDETKKLNQHALNYLKIKSESGKSSSGDHFRKAENLTPGQEGRGWNQRDAIRKTGKLLLKNLLLKFKKVQNLIFGENQMTTTEFQFNATYNDDIGHIHIDRPAGFLNDFEADSCRTEILAAMNKLSFQAAFYTTDEFVERNNGTTGFLPGSHKMLQNGINPISLYNSEDGKKLLSQNMFHADFVPKNTVILFQSSILHRTGSNQMKKTRIAYLVQNQMSCLFRMEGNVKDKKIEEYAQMIDVLDPTNKKDDDLVLQEIYNNYPFPCNLDSEVNKPSHGYLTPSNLYQRLSANDYSQLEILKESSMKIRKSYFEEYFRNLDEN